jgi:hypothetical protein
MNTLGFQDETDMKLVAPAATDEALVAATKLGNHPAFAELWTHHSNTAFKMAYRIVGNRDDAEDVIQDACMKAYRRRDRLVHQTSPDATVDGLPYCFINCFQGLLLRFLLRHFAIPQ